MSRRVQAVLAVLLCLLAVAGVGLGLYVRQVGWSGLWEKKKAFIRESQPELAPLSDKADKYIPRDK